MMACIVKTSGQKERQENLKPTQKLNEWCIAANEVDVE